MTFEEKQTLAYLLDKAFPDVKTNLAFLDNDPRIDTKNSSVEVVKHLVSEIETEE